MRCAIFLLLLLSSRAFAGEPVYTWRTRADDPDRIYLYRDGKQIGGWCYRAMHYRSFDGENWGPPSAGAPVPPPQANSPTISTASVSPRRRWILRPIKSRVDAAMDEIMEANAGRWAAEAIAKAFAERPLKLFGQVYLIDVDFSAKLFIYLELGGKLDVKPDSDEFKTTQQIKRNGSARIFLAEKAKFVDKLSRERFSNPVLTTVRFETLDDDPGAASAAGWNSDAELQSIRIPLMHNWNDDPPSTIPADTPSVLLTTSRRQKDATEKNPVTVRCSFTFAAQKEGKPSARTLSFDLYLETLEIQNDAYPWKVRNVEYK